jgi:hypothetical protein
MKRPDGAAARAALADSVLLAVACLVSYLLVSTRLIPGGSYSES